MGKKWRSIKWPKITRDGLLFVGGLSGVTFETIRGGAERPSLLMLFAGMMGLPVFLSKDEKKDPPKKSGMNEDGGG